MTITKKCLVNYRCVMSVLQELSHPKKRIPTNGLRTIGSSITCLTKTVFNQVEHTELVLMTQWPNIVGTQIATLCLPTGLLCYQFGQSKVKILSLQVVNGSAAVKLQHCCLQISELVNMYFCKEVVTSIKLFQGPLLHYHRLPNLPSRFTCQSLSQKSETILAREIGKISSDSLRNAISSLGYSIFLQTQNTTDNSL